MIWRLVDIQIPNRPKVLARARCQSLESGEKIVDFPVLGNARILR